MVIGTVSPGAVLDAIAPLEKHLRRPVNPTIYTMDDLQERLRAGNHFALLGEEQGISS
jgi:hypothetical protein